MNLNVTSPTILHTASLLLCLNIHMSSFGAAQSQENMEEINRRYETAQTLLSAPAHEAGTSSSTLFDDSGERKRTQRTSDTKEQEPVAKSQRRIEHPAELVAESDALHRDEYSKQFFIALANNNPAQMIAEAEGFDIYGGDLQDLIKSSEFSAFLHDDARLNIFLHWLNSLDASSVSGQKHNVLKAILDSQEPNTELYKKIAVLLEPKIILVGKDGSVILDDPVHIVPFAKLLVDMYSLGFADQVTGNMRVSLPEFSTAGLAIVARLLTIIKHYTHLQNQLQLPLTPAQRNGIQLLQKEFLNLISTLFAITDIEILNEAFAASIFLNLSPAFKARIGKEILNVIRKRKNGDFSLLNSLTPYAKRYLADLSYKQFSDLVSFEELMDTPASRTAAPELFAKERQWRIQHHVITVGDISEQPIISLNGALSLSLANKNIGDIKGLDKLSDTYLIQEINLEQNHLTSLPAQAFKAFPNLKKLYLNDNMLTGELINVDAFQGLDQLEELDLSGNNLASISVDVFKHLPNLRRLNLSMSGPANQETQSNIEREIKAVTGSSPEIIW